MHVVYILRCADGTLYVGETTDLERRLLRHNNGDGFVFTARRRPVSLVFSEAHKTSHAASQRERQLKRWTRAKKEALIAGDLPRLKRL